MEYWIRSRLIKQHFCVIIQIKTLLNWSCCFSSVSHVTIKVCVYPETLRLCLLNKRPSYLLQATFSYSDLSNMLLFCILKATNQLVTLSLCLSHTVMGMRHSWWTPGCGSTKCSAWGVCVGGIRQTCCCVCGWLGAYFCLNTLYAYVGAYVFLWVTVCALTNSRRLQRHGPVTSCVW